MIDVPLILLMIRVSMCEESRIIDVRKKKIASLVEVSLADNVNDGINALVQTYGMGALSPRSGRGAVHPNI